MTHPNSGGEDHPIDALDIDGKPMSDERYDEWVEAGKPVNWVAAEGAATTVNQQAGRDQWALDPGIFYQHSTMVYPVHPDPSTAGGSLNIINKQQYDYMVHMATNIIETLRNQGESLPDWYTRESDGEVAADADVLGNAYDDDTDYAAGPSQRTMMFMAWWNGVKDNQNWTPILAAAASRMGSETGTTKEYIEIGAPGHRQSKIFAVDNVVRLITKYGIDFLDLSGPHGYGLLETAATFDLDLDPLFDIASTAMERHRSTRTVSTDTKVNLDAESRALQAAVSRYNHYMSIGHNHVQAKIYTFGGYALGERVMKIGDGTAESDLTGEEMGTIMGILGPNWQQELADMDAFDGQDPVGSYRFAGYLDDLVNKGPVEVEGEAMREAARVLAAGWRMQPLSDNELDVMVQDFGSKLRANQVMAPVWGNTLATGHPSRGHAAMGSSGLIEKPSVPVAVASAVRGTPEYQRLYGNMPTDMGEEEWIGKFAGASQSLTGIESRSATRAGMETGNLTHARQVGLTDPEARGGTWYRRMAAWRKAFQ